MEAILEANLYREASGVLSIALQGALPSADMDAIEIDFTAPHRVALGPKLLDGHHRVLALRRLVTRELPHWVSFCKRIPVLVWTKANGDAMTAMDILHVGGFLNESTSTVKRHSVADYIHAAISTARAYVDTSPQLSLSELTVQELTNVIIQMKSIGKSSTQAGRYARIALRLASSDVVKDAVMKALNDPSMRVGIVHLAPSDLLTLNDEEFIFALEAVQYRLESGAPGRFDEIGGTFYRAARRMYHEVSQVAALNNMSMEDIRSVHVDFAGREQVPVPSFAALKLAKVNITDTDNDQGDRRRVSEFRKKLQRFTNLAVPSSNSGAAVETCAAAGTGDAAPAPSSAPHTHESDPGTPEAPLREGDAEGAEERGDSNDGASPAPAPVVAPGEGAREEAERTNTTRRSKRVRSAPSRTEEDPDFQGPAPKKRRVTSTKQTAAATGGASSAAGAGDDGSGDEYGEDDITGAQSNEEVDPGEGGPSADEVNEEESGTLYGSDPKYVELPRFDDDVPDSLPLDCADPVPNEDGERRAFGARMLLHSPTYANGCNVAKMHPGTLLKECFVPGEHRAHIFLKDVREVVTIVHQVFFRAGLNHLLRLGGTRQEMVYHGMHTVHTARSLLSESDEEFSPLFLEWTGSVASEELAQRELGLLHGRLMERGFVVFEGLVNDTHMPEKVPSAGCYLTECQTPRTVDGKEVQDLVLRPEYCLKVHEAVTALFAHMVGTFPSTADRGSGKTEREWMSIVNEGGSKEGRSKTTGAVRYMSTRERVMEYFEQSRELVGYARTRAVMDVYAGVLLRLILGISGDEDMLKIEMPRSGGRFLASVPGTQRQKAHMDFDVPCLDEVLEDRGVQGYFCMVTGPEDAELFIVKHAHRIVGIWRAWDASKLKSLNEGVSAELVKIPPYSCVLVRGDCVHFGAGFGDRDTEVVDGVLIRYHMYFIRSGIDIGDAVNWVDGFCPKVFDRAALEE